MKRKVFLIAWLSALGLAALIPTLAVVRGVVRIGPGAYHSQSRLTHPLLSFGGDVFLPKGSDSMVISIFGAVHEGGAVKDDTVAIEAPVFLQRGAVVDRDVLAMGNTVYRAPAVRVNGRIIGQTSRWYGQQLPPRDWLGAAWHFTRLTFAIGLALLLICVCIAVALPWQTVMVANSIHREPGKSVLGGFMGVFLFVFLVVPLGLSLFGLPVAVILAAAAAAAWLLGLTAFAVTLGRRVARLRGHDAGLIWAVVAGMCVITLCGVLPFVGPVVVGFAGATGAGSLALTMVGRSRLTPMTGSGSEASETIPSSTPYIKRAGVS